VARLDVAGADDRHRHIRIATYAKGSSQLPAPARTWIAEVAELGEH
jgi:hypothetical protein